MHATTRAGPCLGLIRAVGGMTSPLRVVDAQKEPTWTYNPPVPQRQSAFATSAVVQHLLALLLSMVDNGELIMQVNLCHHLVLNLNF